MWNYPAPPTENPRSTKTLQARIDIRITKTYQHILVIDGKHETKFVRYVLHRPFTSIVHISLDFVSSKNKQKLPPPL